MRGLAWGILLGLATFMLAGCECNTCPKEENSCTACLKFYQAEDPCTDGKCNATERESYARLGYACADKLGMVPLSPRYNLPAIDCPVTYSVDKEALCPPTCAELGENANYVAAESGFLMTAFDTAAGTRFVMVEADKQYNPQINFADAASDMNGVAHRLQSSIGSVAVYLTEFPLVNAPQGQTSRQPKESEVEMIRQSLASLGKSSAQVQFVRWK